MKSNYKPQKIQLYDYQLNKAQLGEDVHIDTTLEQLVKVAFEQIQTLKK